MDQIVFDTNNVSVQMILVLKLQQLNRESLPSLTYETLEQYLEHTLWRKNKPLSLHIAADDVMSIQPSDLVRYMSKRAILDGANSKLDDFSDVIGGK